MKLVIESSVGTPAAKSAKASHGGARVSQFCCSKGAMLLFQLKKSCPKPRTATSSTSSRVQSPSAPTSSTACSSCQDMHRLGPRRSNLLLRFGLHKAFTDIKNMWCRTSRTTQLPSTRILAELQRCKRSTKPCCRAAVARGTKQPSVPSTTKSRQVSGSVGRTPVRATYGCTYRKEQQFQRVLRSV